MNISKFILQLERKDMLTPHIALFSFGILGDPNFSFIPGQFITIQFADNGKNINRSYSIASTPNGNKIELAVTSTPNGPGTKYLFGLKIKNQINAIGPFGHLVLPKENPKRYILVGTSTGISPFRSMISSMRVKLQDKNLKIVVIEGVTTKEHSLFKNNFLALSQEFDNFQFHVHYSREKSLSCTSYEHLGYVQKSLQQLDLDPRNDIVYLCGNPNMIAENRKYLQHLGFTNDHIKFEKYYNK